MADPNERVGLDMTRDLTKIEDIHVLIDHFSAATHCIVRTAWPLPHEVIDGMDYRAMFEAITCKRIIDDTVRNLQLSLKGVDGKGSGDGTVMDMAEAWRKALLSALADIKPEE